MFSRSECQQIDIKKLKGGKGFWKLNSSLLGDKEFCHKVERCIIETKRDNLDTDKPLLWDMIKCRIRGVAVKYSAKLKRERMNIFFNLENTLVKAKDIIELYPIEIFPHIHRVLEEKIIKLKNYINDYIAIQTKGHIIRSRVQYYEEGETNSKYFLGLEKRKGDSKSITFLTKDNGDCVNAIGRKTILCQTL